MYLERTLSTDVSKNLIGKFGPCLLHIINYHLLDLNPIQYPWILSKYVDNSEIYEDLSMLLGENPVTFMTCTNPEKETISFAGFLSAFGKSWGYIVVGKKLHLFLFVLKLKLINITSYLNLFI